jgi:glycosyltransferase involved in cell wall biosynthesis
MKIILCPIKAANRPVRILWEQIILPVQARLHNIDVLLSAGTTSPFICPVKSILVIHDLQHVNQPWNFSGLYLPFLKSIIYLSAKSADAVIAISQKVKNDIVKHYKISPNKISVVYNGTDHNIFFVRDKDEVRTIKKKYDLPDRFLLYTASSLPHKNHKNLLEAFKVVKEGMEDIKLVLIGARDYGYQEIVQKIKALGIENDVIFLGWLPFEDIPAIYCASHVFVFPSLHEGFGLPVIEAMASGVPVVCSGIEPLTEIAADAALFIDPYNPRDMAKGIIKVLEDKGGLRKKLINKGLKRAGEFTWENTAYKTLSALEL